MLSDDEKAIIVEVLCGQALADHLGDVRDTEEKLWKLLDAPELPYNDPAWDADSAFSVTRARLRAVGLPLPSYLSDSDDDDEENDA